MKDPLASASCSQVFCARIYRANRDLSHEDLVQLAMRERDRCGRLFKDKSLRKHFRRLLNPTPSRSTRWAPTPGLVREAFRFWTGKRLQYHEALRISNLPEVGTRYRGEPMLKTLLWLGR